MPSNKQRIGWRACGLPKRGHTSEEYEDAFAGDAKTGRFAVADGASESSFARLWAKLLVGGFVFRDPKQAGQSHWLMRLQQRWAKEVDGKELAWFAETKRQEGAFATFLGVALKHGEDSKAGNWLALAVGDSCMFQVRDDQLIKAFPLTSSADFGNRPQLIGSRSANPGQHQLQERGKWQAGDRFFLMTDALAQWFLDRLEHGHHPWRGLELALRESSAEAWIDKLRDQYGLRNDDVTLILIQA